MAGMIVEEMQASAVEEGADRHEQDRRFRQDSRPVVLLSWTLTAADSCRQDLCS